MLLYIMYKRYRKAAEQGTEVTGQLQVQATHQCYVVNKQQAEQGERAPCHHPIVDTRPAPPLRFHDTTLSLGSYGSPELSARQAHVEAQHVEYYIRGGGARANCDDLSTE